MGLEGFVSLEKWLSKKEFLSSGNVFRSDVVTGDSLSFLGWLSGGRGLLGLQRAKKRCNSVVCIRAGPLWRVAAGAGFSRSLSPELYRARGGALSRAHRVASATRTAPRTGASAVAAARP